MKEDVLGESLDGESNNKTYYGGGGGGKNSLKFYSIFNLSI